MPEIPYIRNFETLRQNAGLTKASVARQSKLSEGTISRIEAHKNSTISTLVSAIEALNVLYYSALDQNIDPNDVITHAWPSDDK
jgi:transcriptional regulator with XRE-family HTH domain